MQLRTPLHPLGHQANVATAKGNAIKYQLVFFKPPQVPAEGTLG
jgi:hypothetical protein